MRRLSTIFLPLALAACQSGSATSSPTASNSNEIINGITDQGHAYVVGVGDTGGIFCTGTVVSTRSVVTAGHCFGGISRVYFGTNGGQSAKVIKEVRHPGYNGNTLANDLAMLQLETDAPVQPSPLLRETMANNPTYIGPPLTFVGYGLDENNGFGKKKVVTFPIVKVGPGSVNGPPGASTDSVDSTQFYYATPNVNTCNGDSGGPAFMVRDGVERHAGTTSYGDQDCVVDGVDARTDQPAITGFIQARIDQFEPNNACKSDGTCNEDCNTGGQVKDADCHENHCAQDGICAEACVAPIDPDCGDAVNHCGKDGACDLSCTPADPDCEILCPDDDCGDPVGAPDAGPPDAAPSPPDAAPSPPDATPIDPTPDAAPIGQPDAGTGTDDPDGSPGGCGCEVGAREGAGATGSAAGVLALLGAAIVIGRRRRRR